MVARRQASTLAKDRAAFCKISKERLRFFQDVRSCGTPGLGDRFGYAYSRAVNASRRYRRCRGACLFLAFLEVQNQSSFFLDRLVWLKRNVVMQNQFNRRVPFFNWRVNDD